MFISVSSTRRMLSRLVASALQATGPRRLVPPSTTTSTPTSASTSAATFWLTVLLSKCTRFKLRRRQTSLISDDLATTAMDPPLRSGSFRTDQPKFDSPIPTSAWTLVPVSATVSIHLNVRLLTHCLAAGDGVQMKIWQCYDNLPAQAWYFTGDNRIALENQGEFNICATC